MTGFIQRELDKISTALRDPSFASEYDQLYAAQQALGYALEPNGFKPPFQMITGAPAGPGENLPTLGVPLPEKASLSLDENQP